jgi:hypothetical protein
MSRQSITYIRNSNEKFENTKGVIRIPQSKKDRQYNGQTKKDKKTKNDLQNFTHKTVIPIIRSVKIHR